jgi:hypothetical protein
VESAVLFGPGFNPILIFFIETNFSRNNLLVNTPIGAIIPRLLCNKKQHQSIATERKLLLHSMVVKQRLNFYCLMICTESNQLPPLTQWA